MPVISLVTRFLIKSLMIISIMHAQLYAEESEQEVDQNAVIAIIDKPYVNIHTGPGRGYAIFYVAERGEKITLLYQRTNWLKIKNSRQLEGWVNTNDIKTAKTPEQQSIKLQVNSIEDYYQRTWELGVMSGDFGGNDLFSFYGSAYLTENLSTEISYTQTFGSIANGEGLAISLLHHPFPQSRYSPFMGLGAGYYETKPKSNIIINENRSNSSAMATVGLNIYLAQRLLLRLQYNNYLILTNLDDDEDVDEWKIGISTFY